VSDAYEIAVARDEAKQLADRLVDILPTLALPGAQIGVGIVALAFAIRRLIATRPVAEQAPLREQIALIIRAERLP